MGRLDLLHHDTVLAVWHLLRPPILALAAVLAAWGVGARCRLGWLAGAACGLGLAVGWFALFGVPSSAHALIASHAVSDRVRLLSLATVVASILAAGAVGRERWVGLGLGLLSGWWMAGAPITRLAAVRDAPSLAACVAIAALFQFLVASVSAGPVLAAAVALVGALAVTGAAPLWLMLALVPLVCTIGLWSAALPANRLAVASGLALACIAMVQAAGLLPGGRFGAIDAACLAPLLTLFLAPRLGQAGPKLSGAVAVGFGVGLAVVVPRLIALFSSR